MTKPPRSFSLCLRLRRSFSTRAYLFCLAALGLASASLLACAHSLPVITVSAGDAVPAGRAFGAIAFSRTTRYQAASSGWATRGQAEGEANRLCGAPDCAVVTWVEHSCAALAASPDSVRWGWGSDHRRERAESDALATCGAGANDCRVLRWVCTD
jgi:hypothetical protein